MHIAMINLTQTVAALVEANAKLMAEITDLKTQLAARTTANPEFLTLDEYRSRFHGEYWGQIFQDRVAACARRIARSRGEHHNKSIAYSADLLVEAYKAVERWHSKDV